MQPHFFKTPADFRKWLAKNHASATELLVGFYKKDSGKPSLTWPESVDEALCFGWIDGVRRRIDDVSYSIRFTPRKKTSTWSAINIARVAELTKLGRMQPAGLLAFGQRREEKSAIYAYENEVRSLPPDDEKKLRHLRVRERSPFASSRRRKETPREQEGVGVLQRATAGIPPPVDLLDHQREER